jgi:hypothetical protein
VARERRTFAWLAHGGRDRAGAGDDLSLGRTTELLWRSDFVSRSTGRPDSDAPGMQDIFAFDPLRDGVRDGSCQLCAKFGS